MLSRSGMNLLLIPHICLSCHDDTVILTNHICLFQEDAHMRTTLTHEHKTNIINNEDAVVEMNTENDVTMEMKLGKVSLNHDTCTCHRDCFRNSHSML